VGAECGGARLEGGGFFFFLGFCFFFVFGGELLRRGLSKRGFEMWKETRILTRAHAMMEGATPWGSE